MNTVSNTYKDLSALLQDVTNDAKRGFQTCLFVDNNNTMPVIAKLIDWGYVFALIDYDYEDYCGEYCITFDDTDGRIWVERCWVNKNNEEICYFTECDIAYMSDICDKEIYVKTKSKSVVKYTLS